MGQVVPLILALMLVWILRGQAIASEVARHNKSSTRVRYSGLGRRSSHSIKCCPQGHGEGMPVDIKSPEHGLAS